jgi:hypothetical protein
MRTLPEIPEDAARYLDFVGLLGVLRVALFEAFGDRKYWDERYVDLFLPMLAKQLRGKVSTLDELTSSMTNISHSTKIRLIEEARKDGLIEVANRSQIKLDGPLETVGARKVFFLSQDMLSRSLSKLDEMIGVIGGYKPQG